MSINFIDLKAQQIALKEKINKRIQDVLSHGQYVLGPEVTELEEELQKYTGAKYAISCASGTDALMMSLMAIDLQPGDEVITTPFTFIATAETPVLLGLKPVFVDIEPDTFNIDVAKIEAAITNKTKAIIPVSLYGQPCDMDEINAIARKHGLYVIEDAAQSFGSEYKGKKSCNLSTLACTSFFPAKPLGCYGDGGAVFTEDAELAKRMREIRTHGQESRYYHPRIGINGRMDTLQCAIMLPKLERFPWEVEQRQRLAKNYDESFLRAESRLEVTRIREDRTSVFAQYTVKITERESFRQALQAKGIPTAVHYPVPVHKQPAYRSYAHENLKVAERSSELVVSLPMYPDMTADTQDFIIESVLQAVAHAPMKAPTARA